MKQLNLRAKQGGMAILSIIFVAVALIAVLAAYLTFSKPSPTTAANPGVVASSITDQGSLIGTMLLARQAGINSVYSSQPAATIAAASTIIAGAGSNAGSWIYDQTNSGMTKQSIMTSAMANQSTNPSQWVVKTTADSTTAAGVPVVSIKGVGTDAAPDNVIAAYDLSLSVCQAINAAVNQAAITATPPASGIALADWQTPSTVIDLVSTPVAGITGVLQGCVGTSDAKYVYYSVTKPN